MVFVARFRASCWRVSRGLYVATDLIPVTYVFWYVRGANWIVVGTDERVVCMFAASARPSFPAALRPSFSVCLPVPIYSNRSDFSRQLASSRAKLIPCIACTQRWTILPAWAGRVSGDFLAAKHADSSRFRFDFACWLFHATTGKATRRKIDEWKAEFWVVAKTEIIVVSIIPRRKL